MQLVCNDDDDDVVSIKRESLMRLRLNGNELKIPLQPYIYLGSKQTKYLRKKEEEEEEE